MYALCQVGYLLHLDEKSNTQLPTTCMFKSIVGRLPGLYINPNDSVNCAERNVAIALVAKTLSTEYELQSQTGLYRKKQIKQIFASFLHAGFKKILSKSKSNGQERIDDACAVSSLSQRNV